MFNAQALTEKWSPVLGHEGAGAIKDNYRKAVTAVLLENTERQLREERGMINEASAVGAIGGLTHGNNLGGSGLDTKTGGLAGFDPVMISLIRRAAPNLVAYDICGVQPMSGPTGLIFAMKSHYNNRSGAEALYNEPDANFSGNTQGPAAYNDPVAPLGDGGATDANPGLLNDTGTYERQAGNIPRETAEVLGSGATLFNEMDFSIEKTAVTAKTRALRAEYTLELAQDLKAIHGLDAEQELANLLSSEILAEINREVVRTVYTVAKPGAQNNVANAGIFDLDVDSNGRWSVEKFKGLMFQIERDANAIAQQTRRGKGNFIITSADVASALAMSGTLDYSSGLSGAGGPSIGEVDDTGNLLVGTMNGRIKVYVDPYSANVSNNHYYVVGYKGSSPYDAGLFYCPYVPLQMLRSIDPETFQPKIGFKTRYGMVANPFVEASAGTPDAEALTASKNQYYRRVLVKNLM
ncbi:major head protein [Synechococcus phage S-WAM2]|uniref:Major capsid protein n=1 Tax=Synechococcus phage S-WAM2 TaxID=1815522 RepID=A0A1D8KT66_9CAUD|nr:major head protein [Synechococcus phage S-WAM2]AOV61819.1 major capsid protein [Synechococcus phage S-WAM2]